MKKIIALAYAIVCGCLYQSSLFGWATPEQNGNHISKPKVNFSGSIKTHQGNKWDTIENITIDGKYTQIQMRILPEERPGKTVNPQTNKDEIILKDDPNGHPGYTIAKIDLANIKSIQSVPNLTYVYKTQNGNNVHVTTYVEIIITPKSGSIETFRCLALETMNVKWDIKGDTDPGDMVTPIGAVALLEITDMKTNEPIQSAKAQ